MGETKEGSEGESEGKGEREREKEREGEGKGEREGEMMARERERDRDRRGEVEEGGPVDSECTHIGNGGQLTLSQQRRNAVR